MGMDRSRMEVRLPHPSAKPVILGPSDYIPGMEPKAGKGTTARDMLEMFLEPDEGKIPHNGGAGCLLKMAQKFIKLGDVERENASKKGGEERCKINDAIMTLHDAEQVLDIVVNSPIVTSEGDYAEQARQLKSLLWVLHPLIKKSSDTLYEWEMSR